VHLNIEVTVARSRANVKPRSHRQRIEITRSRARLRARVLSSGSLARFPFRSIFSRISQPRAFPAAFPTPRRDSTTSNKRRLRSIGRERTADFLSSVPLGRVRLISSAIGRRRAFPSGHFRASRFIAKRILEIPRRDSAARGRNHRPAGLLDFPPSPPLPLSVFCERIGLLRIANEGNPVQRDTRVRVRIERKITQSTSAIRKMGSARQRTLMRR